MAYFDSSAGKVHFEVCGEGECLVFVHGRTLDMRMWQPQIDYFKSKYQCIVYDLNGFGKSEIPSDCYSRAETLKELLVHVGIKKAHFVGLSLGVYVVLELILKNEDLFKSIVLMSPAVPGRKYSEDFIHDWELVENAGKEGDFELAKKYWVNCKAFSCLKFSNPNNFSLFTEIINDYTCWDIHNAPASKPFDVNADVDYKKIKTPTLVGYGGKDYDDFINNAKFLNNNISGSQIFSVEDSSHMLNLEFPDLINKYIDEFIKKLL